MQRENDGKRARSDSEYMLVKGDNHSMDLNSSDEKVCPNSENGENSLEDLISKLPDELIIYVLSFLTLKEAALTSILAMRWKNLWIHVTRLDFDDMKPLDTVWLQENLAQETRVNYTNWVNSVVELHKGSTLKEFRICCDLDASYKDTITDWLLFALAKKRLQRLEINLTVDGKNDLRACYNCYHFPAELFRGKSNPSAFVGLESLQDICFKSLNLSGEHLQELLSLCPRLTRLTVWGSRALENVRVIGHSLVLNYLEIRDCCNIEYIEISDTNLVTFYFNISKRMRILFRNVPQLTHVTVSCAERVYHVLGQLSSCLSQIEFLTMKGLYARQDIRLNAFPEFRNLKELVLKISDSRNGLLGLISLVVASPFLQRFVLQNVYPNDPLRIVKKRKLRKNPHYHLKVIELVGYEDRDIDLALYFLENAKALERMTIDPCNIVSRRVPSRRDVVEEQRIRSKAIELLEGKVPNQVELVIL